MTPRTIQTLAFASIMLLAGVAGAAEARSTRFRARMHGALAQSGVTSDEIADGAIGCADLAPEVQPPGCAEPGSDPETAGVQNVFVDGFTQTDKDLPSTPSANTPAASIAKLTVSDGNHVIFASIVWSASPTDFSGIVTCHLVPPNGPNSKAEFIGHGVTTSTLFVQTTNVGPGVVDFRCSDQDPGSTVRYRFLQLTAIPVPALTRTQLP
ncbi:MAG TPA: hypothetical protein VMS22_03020 [Candidatus Eisenbacteria bacterium]|nr:hypothetical protein [Candidatus Eisenbacteria bacterium]